MGVQFTQGKAWKRTRFWWEKDRIQSLLWDMLSLRGLEDIAGSHVKQGIGYTVLVLREQRPVFNTAKAMGVDEIA